jgi:hypothetical protein
MEIDKESDKNKVTQVETTTQIKQGTNKSVFVV